MRNWCYTATPMLLLKKNTTSKPIHRILEQSIAPETRRVSAQALSFNFYQCVKENVGVVINVTIIIMTLFVYMGSAKLDLNYRD